MKTSAYSIGLILLLLPSAAAAQGNGPLVRAVTREAVRLAAVQSGSTSAESNWLRVRGLAPGTDVVVTVRGSKPDRRRVVQSDDSTLSVQSRSTQDIETIARGDILEITIEGRPSERRRALGLLGGLGGAVGGALAGAYLGGMLGCEAENLGCMGVGMMAGTMGGAVVGYRAVTRTKGVLIYRAP